MNLVNQALAHDSYGQLEGFLSAGSAGKTTTSWLIRGIFDELDKSAGLMGTVEYGLDEFLMTEDGDLWQRDEPDITLTR